MAKIRRANTHYASTDTSISFYSIDGDNLDYHPINDDESQAFDIEEHTVANSRTETTDYTPHLPGPFPAQDPSHR